MLCDTVSCKKFFKPSCSNNNLIVCSVYRPSGSYKLNEFLHEFSDVFRLLSDQCASIPKCTLLITGDFNVNLLKCDSNIFVSAFVNCLYSYGLFPSISRPTRIHSGHSSLIDNIFISDPHLISSGIIYADITDYFPIFACPQLSSNTKLAGDCYSFILPTTIFNIYALINHLQTQSGDFISEDSGIDNDYDTFCNTITQAIEKFLPLKRVICTKSQDVP